MTFEMWSLPEGGLMLGASRTVVGGQARAFEHLRIQWGQGGVVYTAHPSGQTETAFRATTVSADRFVVENPQHDFPTRITYRRDGTNVLVASVEGPSEMGETTGFQVAYRRVSCEGEAGRG